MQIVNIINFVRAVEPRKSDDSFLPYTIEQELKLCNKYGFPSTVLLQYDALVRDEYFSIVRNEGKNAEIGLWLEIVEPLVRDCGLEWRGRFPWDWHCEVGFLIGYTPDERRKLIDKAFEKFREVFGCYPEVVGSWHIDAFSLEYMAGKYHIVASCNCKNQIGTDGYTIWGGYYGGAYYPSKYNMLCPAQTPENQINVPVFRMLGSDPIHQYDLGLGDPEKGQGVMSLEPVYGNSGSDRNWVNAFFNQTFNGKGLALSYAQMGQENSFGWDKIGKGLAMQFELLEKRLGQGDIELLTLGETGRRFTQKYKVSPPTAICADTDSLSSDYKSVWYMSKNYRVNTFFDKGKLKFRDIQLYRESFREKYLEEAEKSNTCFFSTIPLMDGFRFSNADGIAGAYFMANNEIAIFKGEYNTSAQGDSVTLTIEKEITVTMQPDIIRIECGLKNFNILFLLNKVKNPQFIIQDFKTIRVVFNDFETKVKLICGTVIKLSDGFALIPENDIICIDLT